MPITQLDAINFTNQNMNVVASKLNDYRNSIEQQAYATVVASLSKEKKVSDIDDLVDDQKIDGQREHNKEQAEEEASKKAKDASSDSEKSNKIEIKEEKIVTNHILDIKA